MGQREKFATQVDSDLLASLRALAKSEGRQLQALIDEDGQPSPAPTAATPRHAPGDRRGRPQAAGGGIGLGTQHLAR